MSRQVPQDTASAFRVLADVCPEGDYVCTAVRQYADFDQLLPAFIAGDPHARRAFPRAAERYLFPIARQYGAELPEDLLGEVVNQTFLKLLGLRPGDFDPDQRRAGTFMGLVVRGAVRDIRAAYVPPGKPKRNRKPKAQTTAEEASADDEIVSYEPEVDAAAAAAAEAEAEAVDAGPAGADALIEEFADSMNTAELIEIRIDLRRALLQATGQVAEGLVRIHVYGDALGDVAADFGVSRFALNRQFDRYAREMRTAA